MDFVLITMQTSVSLQCRMDADGVYTVVWTRHGLVVTPGEKYIISTRTTPSTLTIRNTGGNQWCLILIMVPHPGIILYHLSANWCINACVLSQEKQGPAHSEQFITNSNCKVPIIYIFHQFLVCTFQHLWEITQNHTNTLHGNSQLSISTWCLDTSIYAQGSHVSHLFNNLYLYFIIWYKESLISTLWSRVYNYIIFRHKWHRPVHMHVCGIRK